MDYNQIIDQLASNKNIYSSLLKGLSEEEYLWRESPDKWCLLEALGHLIDEEVEDFRMRVKTTLETPGTFPPIIDPVGWVKSRSYISQDFNNQLNLFLSERTESVNWLNSLQNPNWDNSFNHPKLGKMSAHLFLTNWLAHDFLHFRQIARIKRAYLMKTSGEDLQYAGSW
jgi:hypothetical protein